MEKKEEKMAESERSVLIWSVLWFTVDKIVVNSRFKKKKKKKWGDRWKEEKKNWKS